MHFASRSHRSPLRPVAPRARRGFTLAEVILAIVILSVGLLALASGSMGVIRQMRAGSQSATAAMVAQSRLEKLRGVGCLYLGAGTATTRGLSEKWTLTTLSSRIRAVSESVSYVPRPGVTKSVVIKGVIPCA